MKPKYWAICVNISFLFIPLFTSSSPCRKDQFAVSYFSTSFNCTDQGLQLGDPACCCGLADVLYMRVLATLLFPNFPSALPDLGKKPFTLSPS